MNGFPSTLSALPLAVSTGCNQRSCSTQPQYCQQFTIESHSKLCAWNAQGLDRAKSAQTVMSFLSGLLAGIVKELLAWLFGVAQKAIEIWQTKKRIEEKNESIKEQTEKAETEEERQAALRRAAEHLGNSNP